MLSVIIPARNEIYLEKTLQNILENAEGEIEIIVELDGWKPDPQIHMNDERVRFIYNDEVIGQRACINHGVSVCKGKYIMKIDAHCAVDKGFDVKLAADCEPDWTVVPRMYNLDIKTFLPKKHKKTDYMYITSPEAEKPFRAMYYSGGSRPKSDKLIDETMCNMGPGWFMHKERFLFQGGCDEGHEGGWGQQGIEVSLKAWLSGGKLIVNKKTWFAHWFRGGVPQYTGRKGFPYQISGGQIERVRKYSRDLWINNKWDKQVRTLDWLVEKFQPPGWNMRKDLTILFYSSNTISKKIMDPVVRSLQRLNYPIVSVTQEPMTLGKNFVVPKERSVPNIYRQVLRAAKEAKTKYVALCEDDCLYTKEHFLHVPKTAFAYNTNRWLLHLNEEIYSYRDRPILSQCIADRESLIANLEERMCVEAKEPIPDKYRGEMGVFDKKIGITEYEYETFQTPKPNLVVCHKDNTKRNRKLLGTDAKPCKSLEPYGDVAYWVKKFKTRKPGHHKQVSYIAGRRYFTKHLVNNIEFYWDPRKVSRIGYYKEAVMPFFKELGEGKKFTDEELLAHPYYGYLFSLRDASSDTRGIYQTMHLNHMKAGIKLFEDIKKNGLQQPIDMFRQGDGVHIYRGTRRILIAQALGIEKITARVFKNLGKLAMLLPDRDDKPNPETIHGIAMQQFNTFGHIGTDKYWCHGYTPTYDVHFTPLRKTAQKVLELGVFRGASIMLWRDVFPNAQIYGMDRDTSKAKMIEGLDRITLLQGSQGDNDFMKNEVASQGKFDVIVDDCSHKASHQKETLEILWPSVAPGGYYVIEDIYWRGTTDPIAMNKLKSLIDELNNDLEIESINFYYNICFIKRRIHI